METNRTQRIFAQYSDEKISRFMKWLENNPKIYELFKRFADQYRAAGYTCCSADLLANRIRWECAVESIGSGYKLDNDMVPMMARKLVADDPSYDGFFVFRSAL